jgi:methylenetetrahydrofolate--tRNA-(uracil-5-)-methyltransferase
LASEIAKLSGSEYLYFWDAIAPIVTLESVDMSVAFRASRYGKHAQIENAELRIENDSPFSQFSIPNSQFAEGDYINCSMTRDEYYAFIDALIGAETAALRDFEMRNDNFFEGCLPVEVLARRGRDALAFGPMRPVGIRDPRTGKRPFAVVQLRQDNIAGTLYNMVGFQTNLKFPEQDRVLRMIPGLANAEFVRYGQMHRNTFINSPTMLEPTLQVKNAELRIEKAGVVASDFSIPNSQFPIFFAGQIVGVEGYVGNAATGLLAGVNAARTLRGEPLVELPPTTMLGALCHYITHAEAKHFQPMKANFGILPPLENPPRDKRARAVACSERAQRDLQEAIQAQNILADSIQPA